uniref:Secreted protein n=1 Tax=Knipowitschia caucasica TaxID=637954 RepID=A0AAV2LUP9_KNICA
MRQKHSRSSGAGWQLRSPLWSIEASDSSTDCSGLLSLVYARSWAVCTRLLLLLLLLLSQRDARLPCARSRILRKKVTRYADPGRRLEPTEELHCYPTDTSSTLNENA